MDKVVKREGLKEDFDEGKLWDSLYWPAKEAHYSEDEAVTLADKAKHRIIDWAQDHEDSILTAQEIKSKAIEVLEELDEDVAFLYEDHLNIN